MPILPPEALKQPLPRMYKVRQHFEDHKIHNIPETLISELTKPSLQNLIPKGSSVALLVGSRCIANQDVVIKTLILHLLSTGAKPFIVPSMGSHGGGDAEKQKKILKGYGICEYKMGVPILSSMDTVVIGRTGKGTPVHVDVHALSANYIIPINRIKKHTDFDAELESGLCKMLSIGIGKHNGCSSLHKEGLSHFNTLLPEVANMVIKKCRVPYGVALVENAHENLHTIKVIPGDLILREEKELLKLSKALMPKLNFDHLDVLILRQIGKNISGAGMDPSITGRTTYGKSPFYTGPSISRIGVLSLSPESHGNAIGVGFADFITRECYDAIDFESTYANCIACTNVQTGKIPLIMKDEREILLAAFQSIPGIDSKKANIVRIQDTLHVTELEISDNLLPYCKENPYFEIVQEAI